MLDYRKPLIGNQMKHILIILSFLLLSSPLFGQSTTEQEEKAIEMFNKMRNEDFFEDGDENNFSIFKRACFKPDGEEHCLGTITYSDGIKYIGEFKGRNPNGQGTEISADEETFYLGNWKEGVKHGFGKQIISWNRIESNTEETKTEFRIGEWKDGEFFKGTAIYDGTKYVGEFKEDAFHGQGTYIWLDGRKYVGEWKDGAEHGQGTYTTPDGRKYVGKWKDGKYHGQGILTTPDGVKYIGGWKDGVRHGIGQQEKNWVRIESNSKEEGMEVRQGRWKDGEFFNGLSSSTMTLTDEKGITMENIYEIYKEGKVDKKKANKTITSILNQ